MWIFGYGSLVWKVDFPYEKKIPVFIKNFVRRFWQLSTDHRGTVEQPGLVATLVPLVEWRQFYSHLDPHQAQDDDQIWGIAYKIADHEVDRVKEHLDFREKDGYSTVYTKVYDPLGPFSDLGDLLPTIDEDVLVYIGTSENPNFMGPRPLEELLDIISTRSGPSGSNRECMILLFLYLDLVNLVSALDHIGENKYDIHLNDLYHALTRN